MVIVVFKRLAYTTRAAVEISNVYNLQLRKVVMCISLVIGNRNFVFL